MDPIFRVRNCSAAVSPRQSFHLRGDETGAVPRLRHAASDIAHTNMRGSPFVIVPMAVATFLIMVSSRDRLEDFMAFRLPTPVPSKRHSQRKDLDIEDGFDVSERPALCKRYKWSPLPPSVPARRLFLGSMLADDSWTALTIVSTEARDIFRAVVFVESSETQAKFSRDIRFFERSGNLTRLESLWGRTEVVVDVWRNPPKDCNAMVREQLQRQRVLRVWKRLGMRPNDVGVITDADETFTHEALLAARHCQVPVFEVRVCKERNDEAAANTQARCSEDQSNELTRTWALGNATYNGHLLRSSLSLSRRSRFLVANTVLTSRTPQPLQLASFVAAGAGLQEA